MNINKSIFKAVLFSTGCVHKQLVMSAGATSMTVSNSPKGAKIKSLGPVEDKFCPEAFAKSSGQSIGMIDEAVRAAQKKSGADAIKDVKVYSDGSCYLVEGDAVKIN